jgi:predicted transcriptional regulator
MYADCLIEAGLLKKHESEGIEIYETTMEGKDFLRDYEKIRNALEKMRF